MSSSEYGDWESEEDFGTYIHEPTPPNPQNCYTRRPQRNQTNNTPLLSIGWLCCFCRIFVNNIDTCPKCLRQEPNPRRLRRIQGALRVATAKRDQQRAREGMRTDAGHNIPWQGTRRPHGPNDPAPMP